MTPLTPQIPYTLSAVIGRDSVYPRWGGVKGGGMKPENGP